MILLANFILYQNLGICKTYVREERGDAYDKRLLERFCGERQSQ